MTLQELQEQLTSLGVGGFLVSRRPPSRTWPNGQWQASTALGVTVTAGCTGCGETLEESVLQLLEGLERTAAWELRMRRGGV